MNWNAFKYSALSLVSLGLLLGASFFALSLDDSSILIESQESKTVDGKPVYNKISFQKENGKDVWLMEQSHHGSGAKAQKWDKIAIVVDRKQSPTTASFYQLQPGDEEISLNLKPVDFKVSCFYCHSNGPRAIRPEWDSKKAKISIWDQARITVWNLRIKSYGKVDGNGVGSSKPFKHKSAFANEKLNIKTCNLCHKDSGFFARGSLTKQNSLAIHFMTESGHMPPPGFSLSEKEKEQLKSFLN